MVTVLAAEANYYPMLMFLPSVVISMAFVAATTPQAAVDELLATDRAFSAASAQTDLVSGLSAMFAEDVIIPNPPGRFAEGKTNVVAALRANADNERSRTEWMPVRGAVSGDGQHGFTVGFMRLHRPDGATLRLKYLSYWVKRTEGWRVVAYKRTRAGDKAPSSKMMAPLLPADIVAPSTDPALIAEHRDSLEKAERSFSDESQTIGLGAAFAKFGTPDSLNLGGPDTAALVVGHEDIAKLVSAGQPPTGGSTLNWAPDKVIVASSGDLGITIGMIHPNAATAGESANFPFFTIWRRATVAAPWRYVAE